MDELYRRPGRMDDEKRCLATRQYGLLHRTEPSKSMPKISGILIRCGCSGLTFGERGQTAPVFYRIFSGRRYSSANSVSAPVLSRGKRASAAYSISRKIHTTDVLAMKRLRHLFPPLIKWRVFVTFLECDGATFTQIHQKFRDCSSTSSAQRYGGAWVIT